MGQRAAWGLTGAPFAFDGESLVVDTLGGGQFVASLAGPPAFDTYVLGGRFNSGAAGVRQVILSTYQGPGQYYCELYDDGGTTLFAFTYTTDGVSYPNRDVSSVPGRLDPGPVTLTLRHRPPAMDCLTSWPATRPALSGAIPSAVAPDQVLFAIKGLQMELSYFVQIHTGA